MTFSLALQEQYRAEYWQGKERQSLHGTVFWNKYNPLYFCTIVESQTVAVDDGWCFVQVNHQGFPI